MDLTKRDFRAMILYDYKKGLVQMKASPVFEGSASLRATIGDDWFGEFRMGRQSLEDEPRAGRPHTAVTDENVAAIRKLITEDPHITYREIEATLEIGSTAINTILHEYLQVKKLCARWIFHSLSMGLKAAGVD